jgi:hypothetical protein
MPSTTSHPSESFDREIIPLGVCTDLGNSSGHNLSKNHSQRLQHLDLSNTVYVFLAIALALKFYAFAYKNTGVLK